uniref:Peptidase S1 domain-containing protein n=1 Tax=Strigamia maritima TaxID=126957 RepID=T1IYD9_STRMM
KLPVDRQVPEIPFPLPLPGATRSLAQTEERPRLKRLDEQECNMGFAFHWPRKLHKSNVFCVFISFMIVMQLFSSAIARPSKRSVFYKLSKGLIRPFHCYDYESEKSGICMFTLHCIEAKGTPLTTCKDGIFLGSCCHIPPESELGDVLTELQGNDVNQNLDFSSSAWEWRPTSSGPSSSSSSATQTSVVTNVVTSFGIERTTARPLRTTTNSASSKNTLSDNELINGVLGVMTSEKNSPESNSIPNSSWKVTPADSSSTAMFLTLVTRKPLLPTTPRTTPHIDIIDWAIMNETNENYTSKTKTMTSTTTAAPLRKTTSYPRTTATPSRKRTTVRRRPFPTKPMPITTKSTTLSTINITITSTMAPTTTEFNFANADFRDACGRTFHTKDTPTARIVGGKKSVFGKWPWQVSLRQWKKNTFQHKCGAALLNENWAISAAHCVDNVPVEQLQVRIGDFDANDLREQLPHVDRQVQIIAKHPDFNPRNFENDLALIRFYEPTHFQRNIIPICIPQDDNSFINDTAFVTGWGRLFEDGPLPDQLHEAEIPIISNLECEKLYRKAGYIESIPDIFICAGRPGGGIDSCEGDSGGPMVIRGTDQRWFIAGIISWGIGCAEPNQPGVYTRVSRFRDWINAILVF